MRNVLLRACCIEHLGEAQLAADFLARRPGALERVYRAHAATFFSIARRVLCNDDEAADCVHDALLRVWQHAGGYHAERGSLHAYLTMCVRNEAISRRRSTTPHPVLEEDSPDHIDAAKLHRAMETLPSERQTPLELAYFQYLSYGQIAERLALPLDTVKSRLAQALRALQTAFP